MKHGLSRTLALIGLGLATFVVTPTHAQTTANGPYYATPSWDQTLPASTRFIVLSNFNSQAVLDRETGLVWEKSPDSGTHPWVAARTECTSRTVGGRKGWRLPSIHELASLVDATTANPALPAGHPFTNVQTAGPGYWSATTDGVFSFAAWDIFFGSGSYLSGSKENLERVWCVRGAMNADVY